MTTSREHTGEVKIKRFVHINIFPPVTPKGDIEPQRTAFQSTFLAVTFEPLCIL